MPKSLCFLVEPCNTVGNDKPSPHAAALKNPIQQLGGVSRLMQ